MDEKKICDILFGKDTKDIYAEFKKLEAICETSDKLYPFMDLYIEALHSDKSCIRGRGFKLIARNAKWDNENRIDAHLETVLNVLDDETPTVVRQCLAVVPILCKAKKALVPKIESRLKKIDVLKYKKSMQGLVKRDIEKILKN